MFKKTSFVKQVAESLTRTVQSTDECLKNECPICLDEPRVEDAIHTTCAHMFHRNCLLAEFQEQVVRSNKKQVELNKKSSTSSQQPKVEGGSCPVCNEYVKISQLIQIKRNDNGEMTSKYLDQKSNIEKENTPNTDTQRDIVAREALESALSGASSSKLQAVMDELEKVWTLDPFSKVLIFSQFLGYLDIKLVSLANRLRKALFEVSDRIVAVLALSLKHSTHSQHAQHAQHSTTQHCTALRSPARGNPYNQYIKINMIFIYIYIYR